MDELDDEGAPGDFHDTHLILTDVLEAQEVIQAELRAIEFLDTNASSAREFDDLASDVEYELADVPSDDAPALLREGSWYGVNGLEIGVAGLVHALNAVGIVTAASCRSHHQAHAPWADYPVVIFAADNRQMEVLQPLVKTSACGFEIDDVDRPELLAIVGPSVAEMNALAVSIVHHHGEFPKYSADPPNVTRVVGSD